MSREQESLHIFSTFFRQSWLIMLRLIWNLDTEELSRNLGRKCLKYNYLPKSKQLNSWPIFIQVLCISHFPIFKNPLFFQIILQSTTFYRIIALLYSSLKGIQCTPPALDIIRTGNNPQNYHAAPFPPKAQEILPIQNSKYQRPAALQIYFPPLRVHISHSHSLFLPSFLLFFVLSFTTLCFFTLNFKLLKNAQVCPWHYMGKRKKQPSLPCLYSSTAGQKIQTGIH